MTNLPPAFSDRHNEGHGGFITSPTHAIGRFVALHARCPANRLEQSFPLDLRLEVEEWRLQVERKPGLLHRLGNQMRGDGSSNLPPIDLRVRLHHCYVRYRCDGVAIPADSKYRSAIELGTYSEKQSSLDRSASTRDRAALLDMSGMVGLVPSASAKASHRVGSAWQGSTSIERTIVASQDLYEIEAVPGGWRVGDKVYGDPRKRDGCLDGQYFARTIENRPHTCTVEFLPGSSTGSIRFEVSVRDGLRVDRIDETSFGISDQEAAIEAMRDRLAALCIERSEAADTEEMAVYALNTTCHAAVDDNDTRIGVGSEDALDG